MINSLEIVHLNESKQWVYIRSKSEGNPLLLFLHGGPGAAQIYCTRKYFQELENHFIVVDWDQRGSGKSYDKKIASDNLSIGQYVEDVKALAEMLKKRFNKEKIYLVGHSWGSVIGLLAAQQYPQHFKCYIGIGQVVNMLEGEKRGYSFLLEQTRAMNDRSTYKKLLKIGPPPYSSFYKTAIFRQALDRYGGYQYQKTTSVWNDYLKEMLASKEYSLSDIINWFKGTNFLVKYFRDELLTVDFMEQVKDLDVPVYFLAGSYDYITPSSLVEELYERMECPLKKMIFFENAAHDLHFEKPQQFLEVCLEVLERHE
ncbi:MAG TPA: alpha/beta hydrolase, partial [Bacillaceae bacterium]